MSKGKKMAVQLSFAAAFWFVVSFMDLIPAEAAPVVRPELQHYRRTCVSLQMLYGAGRALVGMSYRSVEATPWVALGVSSAAIVAGAGIGHLVCRAVDRRKKSAP